MGNWEGLGVRPALVHQAHWQHGVAEKDRGIQGAAEPGTGDHAPVGPTWLRKSYARADDVSLRTSSI